MTHLVDQYNLALAVIRDVEDGKTVTEACRNNGTKWSVFKRIVAKDERLQGLMEDALQTNYDVLADELINVDSRFEDDSKMAATWSKNVQWVLARRDQARFGDRMITEHKVTADKVIIEALTWARQNYAAGNGAVPAQLTHEMTLPPEDIVDVTPEEDDWLKTLL